MSFVQWYAGPVLAGFLTCFFVNPALTLAGFAVWSALIMYIIRRYHAHPEH